MKLTSTTVKENVRRILNTTKITKRDLARSIHMDESQLSKLFRGDSKIPIDYIQPWANTMGISVEELTNPPIKCTKHIQRDGWSMEIKVKGYGPQVSKLVEIINALK